MPELAPAIESAALKAQTESAKEKVVPSRPGVALCLSGGGFRAALFHLGALRRLNELRVLPKIDIITAVSGGSILAAHIARRVAPWPDAGQKFDGWDEQVATPFRAFTGRDARTGSLLRQWLLPWNWFSDAAVRMLADRYREGLALQSLADLPVRPRFVFCATDMVFGVNWEFDRQRVGDYMAGYAVPAGEAWSVAIAVAASSCFPPLFPPLKVKAGAGAFSGGKFPGGRAKGRLLKRMRLTDGGVYDNLGIEPVWGTEGPGTLLISDGGGKLWPDPAEIAWRRLLRYTAIAQNQQVTLRRRWLMAAFASGKLRGTYWGVGSAVERYDRANTVGYSKELAATRIAAIRTDLNAFTPDEMAILENHGYLLADAAIRRHVPELLDHSPDSLAPPYPDLLDGTRAEAALAESHKRFSVRRWWSMRSSQKSKSPIRSCRRRSCNSSRRATVSATGPSSN